MDEFDPRMEEDFEVVRPVVCEATGIEFTMGGVEDAQGNLNLYLHLPTVSGVLSRMAVIVPSELGVNFFNVHGATGPEDRDPIMRDVPGLENAISKVGIWVQSMRDMGARR